MGFAAWSIYRPPERPRHAFIVLIFRSFVLAGFPVVAVLLHVADKPPAGVMLLSALWAFGILTMFAGEVHLRSKPLGGLVAALSVCLIGFGVWTEA